MKNGKEPKLIQGNVQKTILKLTFHMFWGMVAMVTFNLVDTYYVSRLGTDQLAAMAFTFPIIMILNGIALGIGTGTSAVISVVLGRGDHEEAERLATDSLSLGFIVVLIFILFGYLTIDPVFKAMGAKPEILAYIKKYMLIWYAGVPFVVFPMIGNMAIRATGDMKTPSFIMIMAVIVNMILDPLLIFGIGIFPKMGLSGAALATVFARFTTFSLSLYVLGIRYKLITLKIIPLKRILRSWGKVLYIGLPTALMRVILPLGMGIITRILAGYGKHAVAGFGIATRIEFLGFTVIIALSSVIAPFVGQNLGAKKINRINEGVRFSNIFSIFYGLLLFIILVFLSKPIAMLFNKDPKVIYATMTYLKIASLAYGLYGIMIITNSVLNVIKKPYYSAGIIFTQIFVLYVPLAFLGSYLFGLKGVFIGAFFAYALAGLLSLFIEGKLLHKLEMKILDT
ncbi:MATE family efflux transporter [bacterium]|nr:MATE family efflux transporter [bacterium]